MDIIAITMVLGPILLPTLQYFNFNLIHFGILAVMSAQVGFLTPPFGINLFVSMGVTRQTLEQVTRATIPYMLVLLAVAIVIAYIPEISLFLPNLVFR